MFTIIVQLHTIAFFITGTVVNPENISEMPQSSELIFVDLSAYNSEVGQTDSTPWITASGTKTGLGTIALSRDLIKRYAGESAPFSYGDTVIAMKIYGEFTVEDTMHPRKEKRGDVWLPTRKEANAFGIDKNVILIKGA